MLQFGDPIDGADEDILEEVRNLRVPPQHRLQGAVDRARIAVIKHCRGARMPGAQCVDEVFISSGEGQRRHHVLYRQQHRLLQPEVSMSARTRLTYLQLEARGATTFPTCNGLTERVSRNLRVVTSVG